MTIIELCVDDLQGVRAAANAGADRVELARELSCGGLTPDEQVIQAALDAHLPGGVRILVRENPTSFSLTAAESQEQAQIISNLVNRFSPAARSAQVPLGFVVGGLVEGKIDLGAARLWREAAAQHTLVFHRAFDDVEDQAAALETLISLGFDAVLTTGGTSGKADVEGLSALVSQARGRIAIIGSGGIRSANAEWIIQQSGIDEVHFRSPAPGGGTDVDECRRAVKIIRGRSNYC